MIDDVNEFNKDSLESMLGLWRNCKISEHRTTILRVDLFHDLSVYLGFGGVLNANLYKLENYT
jgi:hypothetical protein